MKISPLNQKLHSNFMGIKVFNKHESVSDDAQSLILEDDTYFYYPFIDETDEQIEGVRNSTEYTQYTPNQYPAYDVLKTCQLKIQRPLIICEAQYRELRENGLSDETLLKIFG